MGGAKDEVSKARLEEDGWRRGGKGEVSKARLEEDGGRGGVVGWWEGRGIGEVTRPVPIALEKLSKSAENMGKKCSNSAQFQ